MLIKYINRNPPTLHLRRFLVMISKSEETKELLKVCRPMLETWDKTELIDYIMTHGKKIPERFNDKKKPFENESYFPLKMAFKFGYLGWDYHVSDSQR